MKINFLFLILFLSSVSVTIAQDNALEKHLKKFKNRYTLGKEMIVEEALPYSETDANLIDSAYLFNYKLVSTDFGKGSPNYEDSKITNLAGYRCEHVGHYKTKTGFVLLSKSAQTSGDGGSPILTLTSIDKNGSLLDFVRFDWELVQDKESEEVMVFSMAPDFKVKHEKQKTDFKFEDDKKIPLKTSKVSTSCSLSEDGHFKFKE